MNSQRWEEIARLYEQALEQEPPARAAFLDQACGGDLEMRRELETLLAQEQAPGLMDRPMWDAAAQLLDDAPALAPGTVLGPYEIDRLVGEGGMGQVFHATDSRLNRSVAIKVLPPTVGIDRQLRERFGREAQAGASLTHPHICTLYDVGSHDGMDFIVMEFLSGETLAARLEKGPAAARSGASLCHRDCGRPRSRAPERHRPSRRQAGERDARPRAGSS